MQPGQDLKPLLAGVSVAVQQGGEDYGGRAPGPARLVPFVNFDRGSPQRARQPPGQGGAKGAVPVLPPSRPLARHDHNLGVEGGDRRGERMRQALAGVSEHLQAPA